MIEQDLHKFSDGALAAVQFIFACAMGGFFRSGDEGSALNAYMLINLCNLLTLLSAVHARSHLTRTTTQLNTGVLEAVELNPITNLVALGASTLALSAFMASLICHWAGNEDRYHQALVYSTTAVAMATLAQVHSVVWPKHGCMYGGEASSLFSRDSESGTYDAIHYAKNKNSIYVLFGGLAATALVFIICLAGVFSHRTSKTIVAITGLAEVWALFGMLAVANKINIFPAEQVAGNADRREKNRVVLTQSISYLHGLKAVVGGLYALELSSLLVSYFASVSDGSNDICGMLTTVFAAFIGLLGYQRMVDKATVRAVTDAAELPDGLADRTILSLSCL